MADFLMEAPTPTEVAALQAFENAYNEAWGWPAQEIDPQHPIQRATLHAIRAAVRAMVQEAA